MDAKAWQDSDQTAQPGVKWTEQLRVACETMSHAPASLIRSISVTDVFSGSAEEAQDVESLGKLLAGEYRLEVLIEVGERNITIHFQREDETEER